MNSYEEHQYYSRKLAHSSSIEAPPPPHILFPNYTSIPHPFFSLTPTAMNNPDVVQTRDYQSYFIGMFIIGQPLKTVLNNRLQTAAAAMSNDGLKNLSVMETPLTSLRYLIAQSTWIHTSSLPFAYQAYLLNFRLHLIDSIAAEQITKRKTPPIEPLLIHGKPGCTLLDPLLFWALSSD